MIKNRHQLQKLNSALYNWLLKNKPKLLDDVLPSLTSNKGKYWTLEKVKAEALKYNSKDEFRKNSQGAHAYAYKYGYMKDICTHMIVTRKRDWTLKELKAEALKYNIRYDFQRKSAKAYNYAYRNNLLDIICKHMKKIRGKYVKNLTTGEIFESVKEASFLYKKHPSGIKRVLQNKLATCGGFHWSYCDKDGNIIKQREEI